MPIADRFVHSLAIVTPTDSGVLDEYGQPVPGDPVVTLVSGNVQPRMAREVAAISQAGVEIGDHVIFLGLTAPVVPASYIRFEPDDGDRYEVRGIRPYSFGTVSDHLEVDARRIISPALALEAS